ncbi:MAG: GNAT family N-acetyltransferase, partial [Alphaproteobacteria bacterium]|nr:GNAT family N-acetyltransferase [Alphaproteobacteria bacterium]
MPASGGCGRAGRDVAAWLGGRNPDCQPRRKAGGFAGGPHGPPTPGGKRTAAGGRRGGRAHRAGLAGSRGKPSGRFDGRAMTGAAPLRRFAADRLRVYLRPIELADIDRGWLAWMTDPEITRHLMTGPNQTRDSLAAYYHASQPPKARMFAICRQADDRYVGNARLHAVDATHRKASYGWLIGDKASQGQGLGSEALFALVRHGFLALGLNRVSTSVAVDNLASLRAQERVGFVREG